MKSTMLRIATVAAAVTAAVTLSTGLAAADTHPSPSVGQHVTNPGPVPPIGLLLFGKADPKVCMPPTGSFLSAPCLI